MEKKLSKGIIFPLVFTATLSCNSQEVKHPNVLLIITDDQGFGDLSFNGNPHLKTPSIDNFAQESIRFSNFYVCPVSAPTRAGLMTGRYSLRTGIHDTYNGGAIMASDEITIAELLKSKGYVTGIFGKWHLGDNYPSRPIDQGFDESVVHLSGGMGQVGDITTWFRDDSSYFDPVLWHNGEKESYRGYCSDIFADQAIKFIADNRNKPFFCYMAFNAPHTPLQVPVNYYQKFKDIDPASGFENDRRPFSKMNENNKEDARKVYAMVENLDENIGRMLRKLDELGITENTIVIFMTDNGPQQTRYNAGLRGLKSSVYRGGVRVPFYFRYPAKFKGNRDVGVNAANIDVFPSIAELCGVRTPSGRVIDGKSLVPLLKGDKVSWADRPLFFYWTRKYPELYNNVALQEGSFKLAAHTDFNAEIKDFELYNTEKDPGEQDNIISADTVKGIEMKKELDHYFYELIKSPNLINPQRIIIGSSHENPVFLNRNDAYGDRGIWAQDEIYGYWRVSILEGIYNIRFRFLNPLSAEGQIVLEAGTLVNQERNIQEGIKDLEMKNVYLPKLDCDLVPFYLSGTKRILPFWVELERVR